jgi:hypothetical protein
MNKFITIMKAWGIASFHNEEQKQLAEERMEVCNGCEFLGEINMSDVSGNLIDNYFMCRGCGCPIKTKIYTPKSSPKEHKCPQGKWID